MSLFIPIMYNNINGIGIYMNNELNDTCADCGAVFYLLDGFLGNPDQNDTSCSVMTEIVPLCASCAEHRGIMVHDDK